MAGKTTVLNRAVHNIAENPAENHEAEADLQTVSGDAWQ